MSEKKAKQERKMKLMTEEADARKVAEEQAKSIKKMYEDRDSKSEAAKKHLIDQLEVTVDKYRTANGVMAALQTVRDVVGGHSDLDIKEEIAMAKAVATEMAKTANRMAETAKLIDPDNFDGLCDGFYDNWFSEGDSSVIEMVQELMALQLCQNVGPDAEDISNFCKQADKEISKARGMLETFCEKNDLDFLEICGEK